MAGQLILAATPIGSAEDASVRLCRVIVEADIIAAEDTRRFRRLCKDLGIAPTAKVVSYFEGNEVARTSELVEAVANGQLVVLVTDAGMPSVSDPGYRVVAACVAAGLAITAAPGPSAVLTALALSGLPVDRFCFEGFLPRKAGERTAALTQLAKEQRTMVFFEAPHRTAASLATMAEVFGAQREAAVCRELTKTYEQVLRGPLTGLVDWAANNEVLGEITIVVTGASADRVAADPDQLRALVQAEINRGSTRRDAIDLVATATGSRRRDVYAAAIG